MSCLVLRLAGPMQAWGAHSRGIRRPSYRAPTYSGLVGLIGAAIGRARDDANDPLSGAAVIVRIDRAPRPMWDFHTINALPDPNDRFERQRERRSQMLTMTGSPYHPTVVTERQYLTDGEFCCFVESDRAEEFAEVLQHPRWLTFLGRKSCSPGPDLLLGLFDAPIADVLDRTPVVTSSEQVRRETHWLSESALSGVTESWVDQPAGPVGAAYLSRPRVVTWRSYEAVGSGSELRSWAVRNRLPLAVTT